MIGALIQGVDAADAVAQIEEAERLGVPAVWATMGGAGGADMLPTFAAAAVRTERVRMGTAILHTWPRHPVVFAQEALAIEQLAPGRLLLGIGPTAEAAVTRTYGLEYRKPLTQLGEYLTAIRTLLHTGELNVEGEHVVSRTRIAAPVQTPVMASALRRRSFELCGELADGAISWMCPRAYLVERALPALRVGAERAGRPPPPLVAHVPIAITSDVAAAHAQAREQLAFYRRVPAYISMFEQAGYDVTDEYSDELLADLVVAGTEAEVVAGLRGWLEAGMGEVLAHPLLDAGDRSGSITRAFAAVAAAAA